MSPKNEINIIGKPFLFSNSSKVKIIYCQFLPSIELFFKYYFNQYKEKYGIVIFENTFHKHKAFQLNLSLSEDIINLSSDYINNIITRNEFESKSNLIIEF